MLPKEIKPNTSYLGLNGKIAKTLYEEFKTNYFVVQNHKGEIARIKKELFAAWVVGEVK